MPNIGLMERDKLTGLCLKKDGTPRKLNKNKGHHLQTPRKLSHDETGKTCIRCHQHKPLTEFYKWNYAKRSYSSICKDCCHLKAQKGWNNVMNLPPEQLLKRREHLALLINKRNRDIKIEVLTHYCPSGTLQCANPFHFHQVDVTDIDVLTIDHINGNGNKERKKNGHHGSTGLYRMLKRNSYPDGYQVLCANCQMKKAIVNNEHPRKYNHEPVS